ncbi:MAG: hypothetical protein JST04_05840 [Bdellovibrionales bacterium]|nr:hypothetical protein [Bdellovibrionales bacterium]
MRDPYWPKWDSPWWHLLLLHELGQTTEETKAAASVLLESMRTHFLPCFFPEELPPGKHPAHHIGCFCALGTMLPALEGFGCDVEAALPWVRGWLMKHTVPGGGMNCDDAQYKKENPGSSIVATVAALEFMVESKSGPRNAAEVEFTHGLARDLLKRELRKAFFATSNAEEKEDEEDWRLLCFPRFYFYDVLRGLTAITRYAEKMKTPIPASAIANVVALLEAKAEKGPLQVERDPRDGVNTFAFERGEWVRPRPSGKFPLLVAVSKIGDPSEALQAEWTATRSRIKRLRSGGLMV